MIWIVPIAVAVAVAVAWMRSYKIGGELAFVVASPSHPRLFMVNWHHGTVGFVYNDDVDPVPEPFAPKKSHFEFRSYPVKADDDIETDLSSWPPRLMWMQYLGFLYYKLQTSNFQSRSFDVPFWSLMLLPLTIPAVVLYRRLDRRQRRAAGLCSHCGYDLRGSEARCPECGNEIIGGTIGPRPPPAAADLVTRRSKAMKWLLVFAPTFLVVGGLCWYGGYKEGERDANSPVRRAALLRRLAGPVPAPNPVKPLSAEQQAAIESQRLAIISVDLVRLFGPDSKPWPIVEYKLRNKTNKAIHQVYGHMEFCDPGRRPLARVAVDISFEIDAHSLILVRQAWDLDEATRSAIADGKVIADYRVDEVYYVGGSEQRFAIPQKDGTFVSAPTPDAK